VANGYRDGQSHLIGPIGREQDESHEHQHEEHASSDESKYEISPQVENEEEEEEEEEDDRCILPDAWEKDYDMDCNSMHEIDLMPTLDSFDFITCGGDRCVFRITDTNDSVVIIKTHK
jgi:cobalamin biosynthesis protein CobT